MATTVEDQAQARPPGEAGWTWKKLLSTAAVAAIVGTVIVLVLTEFIPPLVLFTVLWIVGLVLLRTKPKPATILLLVVFVLNVALSLPFTIPAIAVPASILDFTLTLFIQVATIVGIVAAILVLRGRGDEVSGAPRTLGAVAALVVIVGVALSVYSSTTYDSEEAEGGDVRVVTEDIEFAPTSLSADEGTVTVFIDNKDLTLHTFTIDKLDVDVDVPAGKSTRVTFEAEQGSYDFYCVPHEGDMEGTLEIQ